MDEVKITQKNIFEAFKSAKGCEVATNILTNLFGKQKPDYTDYHNIKTYEDACQALGRHPLSKLYVVYDNDSIAEVEDISHIAYMKLCTIIKALNNDPGFPRFTKDECRWTPYFHLYTNQEIKDMSEEKRKRIPRCLLRSYDSSYTDGGVSCTDADGALSSSLADVGSRLALKSEELAKYCGTQFIELWKDFLFCE